MPLRAPRLDVATRVDCAKPGAGVPVSAPHPIAGSEFDPFLYASIAQENNGMLLSVLSALARLNVDPWNEAARLARLPREAASTTLAALVAALPEGPSPRVDSHVVAERLMALLPAAKPGPRPGAEPAMPFSQRISSTSGHFIYVALLVLYLGVSCFIARQVPPSHDAGSAPAATTARPLDATSKGASMPR